jgi:hypothetical protein
MMPLAVCRDFAGTSIAVLTQHVLDKGWQFLAKNFEGHGLSNEGDFIALGYPDVSLIIVLSSDQDGSHFRLLSDKHFAVPYLETVTGTTMTQRISFH